MLVQRSDASCFGVEEPSALQRLTIDAGGEHMQLAVKRHSEACSVRIIYRRAPYPEPRGWL